MAIIDLNAARRPYIARGLDDQGRRPEAGHAATDLGADDSDPPMDATGLYLLVLCVLGSWALVVALGVLAMKVVA